MGKLSQFDHLRPILTKIAEVKLLTPEYEVCREYALNMLKNEPQLPWNRVVPPTSQENTDAEQEVLGLIQYLTNTAPPN